MIEWLMNPQHYAFWIPIISLLAIIISVIARPFSTYVKFIYPNAKYEAIGNPFIIQKELDMLVESPSLAVFKEKISTIKDYSIQGEDAGSVQKSLDQHFLQTLEMMKNDSSKKMHAFFDVYRKKYDLFYVKNEFKKNILGINQKQLFKEFFLPWTKEFITQIHSTSAEDIPKLLHSFGFNQTRINEFSTGKKDSLAVDLLFDSYFIDELRAVKVPYKCEAAKKDFIQTLIDIYNIKYLLRAKHLGYDAEFCKKIGIGEGREIAAWKYSQLAELENSSQIIAALEGTSYYQILHARFDQGNKEGTLQIIENALDVFLLSRIKEISMKNYLNIGPSLRFMISKEFEIQNLKVISKGISENISASDMKQLLITEAEL